MRTPVFDSETMQRRLHSVALSWIDTPFVAHACIKGAGVDCVHLAANVLIEAGCDFIFNPPSYAIDGGNHLALSKIVSWIEGSGKFNLIPTADFPVLIGDVLLFRVGKVTHHVGVKVTASTFLHALRHRGVIESNVADPTWARRLSCAYRPMEETKSMTIKDGIEHLAGRLYEAYCRAVGGKNFIGDDLPKWAAFRADGTKKKQSDAWVAVAEEVLKVQDV